jgi:Na+/proline symporter
VLAIAVKRATATGAFWGIVGGMATVITVAMTTSISYLWLNVVGAVAVFLVGSLLSGPRTPGPSRAS